MCSMSAMTIARTPVRVLHAVVRADGRWWNICLPELTCTAPDGVRVITAMGQAEQGESVEAAALDLAALRLDVDESTLEVRLEFGEPLTDD